MAHFRTGFLVLRGVDHHLDQDRAFNKCRLMLEPESRVNLGKMRFHGASRTSEFVPDFFVRHPTERPTRTLALSLGQGIKQSPKSATFRFWRIVDHTSSVHAGQMLQLVDDKEFRHNKVSATIPTNFQSRQFTIAHFTVHRPIAIVT